MVIGAGEQHGKRMDTNLSHTSTTLLENVALGENPRAEERFYEIYVRLARAVAHAARVHSNDIDDIVHEAVEATVQGLRENRYDRPRGSFKAWFKAILFHKIGHLRRDYTKRAGERRGSAEDLVEHVADPTPGPQEQVEAAFEMEWEKTLLEAAQDEVRQRVTPINWQAYHMVACLGQERAAVARLLGIRRSQVYNAISRVKADLQEAVAKLRES